MLLIAVLLLPGMAYSQSEQNAVIYTVFVNSVPDGFQYPLFGFVNMARGRHESPQIGFVNSTAGDYESVQMGFINTNRGATSGAQMGYVNASRNGVDGAQVGLINVSEEKMDGGQAGLVNISVDSVDGAQAGLINVSREKMDGAQAGLINVGGEKVDGAQVGLLNVIKKSLRGVQLGLFNYVDTVGSGVPIGLLSIVRRGGYFAFELSTSPHAQLGFAFKVGVPKFYSIWQLDYSNTLPRLLGTSFGIGTLIPLTDRLFLNPEARGVWQFSKRSVVNSYSLNARYEVAKGLQLVAGLVGAYFYRRGDDHSWFWFAKRDFGSSSRVLVGARLGLSYRL